MFDEDRNTRRDLWRGFLTPHKRGFKSSVRALQPRRVAPLSNRSRWDTRVDSREGSHVLKKGA